MTEGTNPEDSGAQSEFTLGVEDFVIELSTTDKRVELLNAFARLHRNVDPPTRTRAEWAAALTDFANAPA